MLKGPVTLGQRRGRSRRETWNENGQGHAGSLFLVPGSREQALEMRQGRRLEHRECINEGRVQPSNRLNTRQALWPPKPKLFFRTTPTSARRASFGT